MDSTVVFPSAFFVRDGDAERWRNIFRAGDGDRRGLGLTKVEKSRLDNTVSSFLRIINSSCSVCDKSGVLLEFFKLDFLGLRLSFELDLRSV